MKKLLLSTLFLFSIGVAFPQQQLGLSAGQPWTEQQWTAFFTYLMNQDKEFAKILSEHPVPQEQQLTLYIYYLNLQNSVLTKLLDEHPELKSRAASLYVAALQEASKISQQLQNH